MDTQRIITEIQTGQDVKKNLTLIYQNNGGLIGYATRQFASRPDYEDIKQEGFIALANACKEYDPEKGTFASYAINRIKWHVFRYVMNQTAAHIPQHILDDVIRYKQITAAGDKSDIELCHMLKINRHRLDEIKKAIASEKSTSLFAHIGNDEGLTLAETIQDERDDITRIEETADRERIRQETDAALDKIPDVLADITRLIYYHNMSIKDVCKRYNIPYSTATTYKARAFRQLRKSKELKQLYDDLYDDSNIYHDSLSHFRYTFSSVTELTAMRQAEHGSGRPTTRQIPPVIERSEI